jgi:hypothetical protein
MRLEKFMHKAMQKIDMMWKGRGCKGKVRMLLTVLFLTVFVCSVPFAYSHQSLLVQTDCPVCKFFAALSSGSVIAERKMIISHFVRLFLPESLIFFSALLPFVLGNRAPPDALSPERASFL